MFFQSETDITYIYHLLKFSGVLCISPPINYKTTNELKKYKWIVLIVVLILLIGSSFTIYGIIKYMVPNVKKSSAVLSLITTLTLCILNVITILVALLNVETWNTFIKFMLYIDKKLNKYSRNGDNTSKILYAEILVLHGVLAGIYGYDGYIVYSTYGWKLFKYYVFKYLHFYYCFISILVILHFASSLRSRFRRINNLLIKTNDLHNIINYFIPNGVPQRVDNLKSINEVTEFYLLLSELVEMFNQIFGWQIFLMTETIIILLLECLNNLMLGIDSTQGTSGVQHEIKTIFFMASYSIIIIIFHARIVICCEGVNAESKNTLNTCYNLQQTVAPTSDERRELIILSDLVNLLKPTTSAAGFYYINRSLLSRVFAYIFSYLIVLIQFNKQLP